MGIRPTFIDTFATELAHYGLGDALWCPEPQDGRHGTEEVQIGDVGYLDDKGSFVRLFNIFYDKDHPVNKHGVPDEFEPLRTNRRLKRTQQPIEHQGPFTSRGVSTVGTEKVMNAPTGSDVLRQISCQISTPVAAWLFVDGVDTTRDTVDISAQMRQYMRRNHLHWAKYARHAGCELAEDVVLVNGCVKTSNWGTAVYQSAPPSENGSLEVIGSEVVLQGLVGQREQFEIRVESGASGHYTFHSQNGPSLVASEKGKARADNGATRTVSHNQCVFVSYYKVKYKTSMGTRHHRPLDDVLEAILKEKPDAEAAICSHEHVARLFPRDWTGQNLHNLLGHSVSLDEGNTAHLTMAQAMYTASKEGLERRTNQQQFAQQEEEEKRDAIAAAGLQDAAVGVEIITSEAEPTRPASDEAQPGSSRQDAPPSDLTPVAAPMSSISPYATRGRDHFQGSIVAVGTCYDSATTQNGHQYPHLLLADSSADGAIHSLALSVSANRLATAHDEQAPRIWDLTTGALLFRLEGHSDSVYTVVFSPDGTKLVSGSADHNAILWDLASHESIAVLTGHKGDVWITAYSPDGAYIATSATDGVVRLWDGEDGRPLVTLPAHPTTVMALKFSPDSKRLVTCADSVGYVWDVATQKQLASMTGHKGMIWSIDFARDEGEQRIVTAAEDGIVYVWSAEDGRVLVTLCEHEGPVWAAVFSPDGGEVTSGGYDGRVVTCDSYLGERKHLLAGDKWIDQIQVAGGDSEELIQSAGRRQGVVNVVAYSADGEMVAAGCADGTVKVWEVGIAAEKSGRFVAEFAGHTDKVTSIVWTPDDESVVSASDDGTIRLWSVVDQMRFGG